MRDNTPPADYPHAAYIGPPFPTGVVALHVDCDPIPLSEVAIERIRLLLGSGVALRVVATETRFLERFCASVEMIADPPAGTFKN